MSRTQRFDWFACPRRRTSVQPHRRPLRFEPLEDRRLLAVFSVSNLNDAGAGSLRDAILEANNTPGADEIDFSAFGTIALTTGELEITETLSITAPGQGFLTIDAQQLSRVLHFTALTGDLTLEGLTLQNGRTTGNNVGYTDTTYNGGGVRFASGGTLTLTSSTLTGNSTAGNLAAGGGIFTRFGDVTLTGSTLSDNSTTGNSAGGGGIRTMYGTVTLTGSTISGNSTTGISAAGGGIFTTDGAVTLLSSTLSDNRTIGDLAQGGGIFTFSGAMTLTESALSYNSTAGDDARGGGIFASNGPVTLTGSTLSGNRTAGSEARGGGVYTFSGPVTLTGSTLSGNNTAGSAARGGGIYTTHGDVTLTDSTLSGNSTAGSLAYGGGIHTNIGAVTLTSSTLSGNSTAGFAALGGGISTADGPVTFTRSTLSYNSTAGNYAVGGGVRTESGPVTLTDSNLSGNSTAGIASHGGGIHTRHGTVTLTGSTLSGNSTTGNDAVGGGISAFFGAVTLTGSTLSGNSTTGSSAWGGAIWTNSGAVTLTGSTLSGNSTTGNNADGGGIMVWGDFNQLVTIENSIVAGNSTALGLGHDLLSASNALTINYSLIGSTAGSGVTPLTGVGNILNQPASLAPLADNGGPTKTHALLANSPAINAGDPSFSGPPDSDQRGAPFQRVFGGRLDIGAFEVQALAPSFFVVTTTLDEFDYSNSDVSLREAINSANGNALAATITFDSSVFNTPQTINIASQLPTITGNLTIAGPGAKLLTIDAGNGRDLFFGTNDGWRIFNVDDGFAGQVSVFISGLTLTGGDVSEGGAIKNAENLTISESWIVANSGNFGGGVASSGTLTVESSTISGNKAALGGGGINSSGTATIRNSTISGNDAGSANGGGMINYASPGNTASLFVVNSTITNNTANVGSALHTFGSGSPAATIHNSILNGAVLKTGSLTGDYNLFSEADPGIAGANNQFSVDAHLGPLTANGGPTKTHALLLGSPAIDAGNPAILFDANQFDQRGTPFARVANGRIDIGAVELDDVTIPMGGLVVDTSADIFNGDYSLGDLSLREAIYLAHTNPGANTITFDAGMSGQTILLADGELAVAATLTIDAGDLADNVVIDAQQLSRVLHYTAATGDLTLEGLTLQNGRTVGDSTDFFVSTHSGGGVLFMSDGTLTLLSSTVTLNSTAGIYAHGGGIFAQSGAVMLTDSTLSSNSTSGASALGGGISAISGAVTLTGSTLSYNSTSGFAAEGGGIFTYDGPVTLTNSTLSGNSTAGDLAAGGGISATSGAVTLTNSTLSGNSTWGFAGSGGGIVTFYGPVTLTNSTLSGNSTAGDHAYGGGVFTYHGPVMLTNITLSGNSTAGSNAHGGGIFIFNTPINPALRINNSIVAGNTVAAGSTGPDLLHDPDSLLTVTYSLIGNNAATGLSEAQTPDVNGNLIGSAAGAGIINPMLDVLADNGGPTMTHALLAGSPAIDAGDPAAVAGVGTIPLNDQRGAGFPRVANGRIDIGAYELQSSPSFPDGDYNQNGIVDAADYVLWRKFDGSPAGYNLWRANFGSTVPASSAGSGAGLGAASAVESESIAIAPAAAEPVVARLFGPVSVVAPVANRETIAPGRHPTASVRQSQSLLALDHAIAEFDRESRDSDRVNMIDDTSSEYEEQASAFDETLAAVLVEWW